MVKKKNKGKHREEDLDPDTVPDIDSAPRRKSKKDRLKDSFFDEVEVREDESHEQNITPSQSKKKDVNAFAALDEAASEEDDELSQSQTQSSNALAVDNQADESEEEKMQNSSEIREESEDREDSKKRKKQKKKKKGKGVDFDALTAELDAEESQTHYTEKQTDVHDDDDDVLQEDISDTKPKKGKKKKKGKGNDFDVLMTEMNAEEETGSKEEETDTIKDASYLEVSQEQEDVSETKPKTGKKKKKLKGGDFEALMMEMNEEEDETVSKVEDTETTNESVGKEIDKIQEDDVSETKTKKGKKKKKLKGGDFEALMMEMNEEDDDETVSKESLMKASEDVATEVDLQQEDLPETKPKKGKKKKKDSNISGSFDALIMEINEEEDIPQEPDEQEKTSSVPVQEPAAEAITQAEASDPLPEEKEPPKTKEKKKKKKKGGKTKEDEEHIDALLAEIDGKPTGTSSVLETKEQQIEEDPKPASSTLHDVVESEQKEIKTVEETLAKTAEEGNEESKNVEDAVPSTVEESRDDEEEEKGEEVKLTAAQKKKLRKKAKKAQEKEQQKSGSTEEAKEKKMPAHLRKIHEQLEKKRLEEEKRRQEEEAEKERIAEEERLQREEEQRKEEEARRKEEEKKKREELKAQGKILTKKQKAEQARLQAVRDQLLKNAGIDVSTGAGGGKSQISPQEQKRIQRERELAKKRAEEERLKAEEEERLLKEEEERKRQAEIEAQRIAEEELRKKQAEEDKIADNWEEISEEDESEDETEKEPVEPKLEDKKEESELESESESETETDSDSESGSSSEYTTDSEEIRDRQIQAAKQKVEARIEEARAAASSENLRSPICCILGHVDTGKTKILDNIRNTNVQDNEAGGITQQIGATYIPSEALLTRTNELRKGRDYDIKVPGLLVIDTPGHESFTNLRTRGSSLCDIAILVVDLMHGLEAQTLESIELLRQKKTPFIIALNKVDRLNDWKVVPNAPIRESLNRQKKHTILHYEDRLQACTTMLMERGLNVALYWKNKEPRKIVNMVPTSAITGEGIADMLQLLIKLTTSLMAEKLMFLSEVQCSVLEVKALEGLGTTVDVVLVNGQLNEGDRIVVCGMTGPIVTTIRSLLTPHPLKELRVKGSYLHHKSIQAAQGIKICAQNLEQAVAGTALRVVREGEEEDCKLLAIEEMEDVLSRIDKTGEGVSVQASTLGSLEALLEFLKSPDVQIPVSAIGIGPVHKKDVMRANVMNEKKLKKFAVILAFDVAVTKEARELSEDLDVKIFTADIIYHLFDQFKAYVEEVRQAEKKAASQDAVFPCILEILPTCIFNKKDPIVLGCEVLEGQARIGTPLVVPAKPGRPEVSIGKIESMELNHKTVDRADRGDNVAIKIQSTTPEEASRLYGRHFDHTDQLYSKISRDSINALKAFFRDEMTTPDWNLVIKLKKVFQIE